MAKKIKELKSQVKKLPDSPGVYLFKKNARVLYVGKAASLKNRVKSYFYNHLSKTKELVRESNKISFHKTDSVLEALILESNLIKKYWPYYNILAKDDKSFAYIIIAKSKIQDFPAPLIVRGQYLKKYPNNNFHIFGPYQNYSYARIALGLLRKIFPYCTRQNSKRPCFHYQIGLCPGVCAQKINKQDYQKIIRNLILFLKGQKKTVIKNLKKIDPDKISVLKHIQDSALISREKVGENLKAENFRIEGYDVSHFSGKGTYGSMVVFENNQLQPSAYRLFKIKRAIKKDDVSALKEMMIRRIKHPEWPYPDLILIDGGQSQVNVVYQILNQSHYAIPVVGIAKGKDKKDRLIFKKIDQNLKEIIESSKPILQMIRDEAHRFAIKFSRRKIHKIKK